MEGTATAVAVQTEAPKPRRRARMRGQSGSIIRRGDFWTIIYRTREGKQKWEGGFRTKDTAQSHLNEVLDAIRRNKYVEPKDTPFREFCDAWMKEIATESLKPATWTSYQSALKNWILPAFGDYALCEIRKADVVKFLYKLLGNRDISRKFVKNVHILLHRLFEAALEQELVTGNPAHKIKLPAASPEFGAAGKVERVVPTPAEVAGTFSKLPFTCRVLLATGAVTGARRGELLGLYWEHVDLVRGIIKIQQALQRVPKKFLEAGVFRNVNRVGQTGLALLPPKSEKASREIEIPPNLATLLAALRKQQNGSSCPFVFQTELGGPIDPDGLYDTLYAAQDAAQVRRFGLHGLRHLYASLLHDRGASVKFQQERLGHANASTTMDTYTHAITDQGRAYAESVEAAFPFPCVSLTLAKPGVGGTRPEVAN